MVTKKKRCQVTIDWNMSHWEGRCTCGKNWRGTSLVRLRSLAKGHTCEGMKIKVGDNPWSTVKDKNGKIILRGNQKYLSVTKAIGKKKPVRSDSVKKTAVKRWYLEEFGYYKLKVRRGNANGDKPTKSTFHKRFYGPWSTKKDALNYMQRNWLVARTN